MESPDLLIASFVRALKENPRDVRLRLHLAELLLASGDSAQAISHLGQALQAEPDSVLGRQLMARALGGDAAGNLGSEPSEGQLARGENSAHSGPATTGHGAGEPPPGEYLESSPDRGFDWKAAENEVGDLVAPRFVDEAASTPAADAYSTERPRVTLADVGGMEAAKQRLEAAFLAPMRNPELRRLYGKSLRGGLLLYGPPGCGKTFLARAVAGEMDAHFLAVGIAEVLDWYIGRSEQNLHEVFQIARRKAPCVLFFDEVDALGQRRSQTRNSAIRTTVNQLLLELDDVSASNEGVFVLGASNQPWDVDPALRRPGRFDRTVLVLPPDLPARRAILTYHLRDRPIAGIDLGSLARRTEGFSGADLAHVCEAAAERALLESVSTGKVRMIGSADLEAALTEVRPSTRPWFESARSIALFANEGGAYDELATYLRQHRMI